jgi:DNA-binding GntR family transcriptional regulator
MVQRAKPLYEQIYDELWSRILAGELGAGERLGDTEWAEKLSVSRTPVREAMRLLARDGVLLTLDNGGYQLRPVDPVGLLELYKCRTVLAGLAAREATLRATPALVASLEAISRETARAVERRDATAILESNSSFYATIVAGSGNAFLEAIMEPVAKLILFYRVSLLKAVRHDDSAEYYAHLKRGQERQLDIVAAMRDGDAAEADRRMQAHLMTAAADMYRLLLGAGPQDAG